MPNFVLFWILSLSGHFFVTHGSQLSRQVKFYKNYAVTVSNTETDYSDYDSDVSSADSDVSSAVAVAVAVSTSTSTEATNNSHPLEKKMSLLQCSMKCVSNTTKNCASFLYVAKTGVCVEYSTAQEASDQYLKGVGDVYISCDVDLGYNLYWYAGDVACLSQVHGEKLSYAEASLVCQQSGGYLPSAKSMYKVLLLSQFFYDHGDHRETDYWVGLYQKEEGSFYWEEDDSKITYLQMGVLSYAYDINQYDGECVDVHVGRFELDNQDCDQQLLFACEMLVDIHSLLLGV